MTIPTDTVGLAIAIVNGLVKLSGKVDRLVAEQTAHSAEMAIAEGVIAISTPAVVVREKLQEYLLATRGLDPDPLADARLPLTSLLAEERPDPALMVQWARRYVPHAITTRIVDPDRFVRDELSRRGVAGALTAGEIARIAGLVEAGNDTRDNALAWRIAMATVDVFAEFTIEAQQSLVKDAHGREIVASILARFSAGDLENEISSGAMLLRRLLGATLNGVLDARAVWDGDAAWLDVVLSALGEARSRATVSDDFLVGLITGRNYRLLVGTLVHASGEFLAGDDREGLRAILAELLEEVAGHSARSPDLQAFFAVHWSDLAQVGLRAFNTHGAAILAGEAPLLRSALLAVTNAMAEPLARDSFSSETVIAAAEAVLAAIAAQPDLLVERPEWSATFVQSIGAVVADRGLRGSFSAQGLAAIARESVDTMARHPQLIIAAPALPRELVAAVLSAIGGAAPASAGVRLEAFATAAIGAALAAVAARPGLVTTRYASLVSEVAGALAVQVREHRLAETTAGDVVTFIATEIAAQPELLGPDRRAGVRALVAGLAEIVGDAEVRAAFSAASLAELTRGVLARVAQAPELLGAGAAQPGAVVAAILRAVAAVIPAPGHQQIERMVVHAIGGTLAALVDNASLRDGAYPQTVAANLRALAVRVRDGRLPGHQASVLAELALSTIARNPRLLAGGEGHTVERVLAAVLDALATADALFTGQRVTRIAEAALAAVAARGAQLVAQAGAGADVATALGGIVSAGVDSARRELGVRIDLDQVPTVLACVIEAWANQQLDAGDPTAIDRAFAEFAAQGEHARGAPSGLV